MMKKTIHHLLVVTDRLCRDLLLAAVLLILSLAVWSETEITRQIQNASGAKYQTYRPSAEEDLSFQDLTRQDPDVIGWIMIPDTQMAVVAVERRT